MQVLDLPALSARCLPKTSRSYLRLTPEGAKANLKALCQVMAPHLEVATELDTMQLAGSSLLQAVPQTCTNYEDALKQARLSCVLAGDDGLSALRVIARCLRGANAAGRSGTAAKGAVVERSAEALALNLKAYLVYEEKRLGTDTFKWKYNENRVDDYGHSPINRPAHFVSNLAVSGKYMALDHTLLAVVGGFLAVDFVVLRVLNPAIRSTKPTTEPDNGAAMTTIQRVHVAADSDTLEFMAQLRLPGLTIAQPPVRPVIPLLEAVEVGRCVYRGLTPQRGALHEPVTQATNGQPTPDLDIWLPEPAKRWAPLSQLRDLEYGAGGVMWSVVRSGRTSLVLQMKRRNLHGQLVIDAFFGRLPVAEIVQGTQGQVVRPLQYSSQEALAGAPAAGVGVGVGVSQLPLPQLPGDVMRGSEQQGHQVVGDQGPRQQQADAKVPKPKPPRREEPELQDLSAAPLQLPEALQTVALRAARRIRESNDIDLLAQEEAGQAASHQGAKETAAELRKGAAEVETSKHACSMMHLVVVNSAGCGKTTFINKTVAELMATPATLRRVLPLELLGRLRADQLPGPGTTVADFLQLFGVDGASEMAGGNDTAAAPPRQFSATFKKLSAGPGGSAFSAGGELDYFDLKRKGVDQTVQSHLLSSWDDQRHIRELGDKYNLCKPCARGTEFGCFMPNGNDTHCTDRVQHVYMARADCLDAAAFRFCLQLYSREEVNRMIHQFRKYVAGEIEFRDLDAEAYIIVPLICGLKDADNEDTFDKKLNAATMSDDDYEDACDEKLDAAAMSDAESMDAEISDADSDGDHDADQGRTAGSGSVGRKEAARSEARQWLLARLYPLQRFEPWLGQAVEFRLLTDDTVGASQWAEFFSTRFILGRENAAFTLSGSSVLHVPAEGLPVHIMDLPGVVEDKHSSNALQAAEVEGGLRAISANVGQVHTVVVLPTTSRESSRQEVIRKLQETQVLQAAINNPENLTLVPLINLRPGSNVVMHKMSIASSGAEFMQSYASTKYPKEYLTAFENALVQTAKDLEAHARGTVRRVRAALKAGQLLQPFTLDVGGSLVEAKPFRDQPEVQGFLFSAFAAFLLDTQQRVDEAARSASRGRMWEQLGGMVFEGVGLAKRLQGPSHAAASDGEDDGDSSTSSDNDEGDDDDAESQAASALNLKKVTKMLKVVLDSHAQFGAGEGTWAAEVRRQVPVGGTSGVPLRLDQVRAWVEKDSALRGLMDECTAELARKRLEEATWGEVYRAKGSRVFGNHLTSSNLNDTYLPDFLISPVKERGEGMLAAMLRRVVVTIIEADIKLVQAQIRSARWNIDQNNARLQRENPEVQLLLDVFEESIAELLRRKKETVLTWLTALTTQTHAVKNVASLPVRWREAIDSGAARAAAVSVYKSTLRRPRDKRLCLATTELLEAWKTSLMPAAGTREPGLITRIVVDLAKDLVGWYKELRAKVINEALVAAKSSTVATLGPRALRVVRAGVQAADIAAAAVATAGPAGAQGGAPLREALLEELQTALKGVNESKKARMQVLRAAYDCSDPVELVLAASRDQGLRDWVKAMSAPPVPQRKSGGGVSSGGNGTRKRRRTRGA